MAAKEARQLTIDERSARWCYERGRKLIDDRAAGKKVMPPFSFGSPQDAYWQDGISGKSFTYPR